MLSFQVHGFLPVKSWQYHWSVEYHMPYNGTDDTVCLSTDWVYSELCSDCAARAAGLLPLLPCDAQLHQPLEGKVYILLVESSREFL